MNNIFSNKNSALSKMSSPMKYIIIGVLFLLLINGVTAFAGGDGSAGNPYQIATLADFNNIMNCLDCNYILNNDINAYDTKTWYDNNGWLPLGTFTGSLNGNKKVISNLYANRDAGADTGIIFTAVSNAHIYNISFENIDFNYNSQRTISSFGNITNSLIEYILLTGKISKFHRRQIGGLGYNLLTNSIIRNTTVDLNIYTFGYYEGENASIGPVVYYTDSSSLIENTSAKGNLIFSDITLGNSSGFVYFNNGTIKDSYSNVNTNSIGTTVGGSGFTSVMQSGIIQNSYAIKSIVNSNYTNRGFLGIQISGGTRLNNFWDITASGHSSSTGQGDGNITGKTTTQMKTKSTFTNAGWDFDTIWDINPSINDGYPFLRNSAGYIETNFSYEQIPYTIDSNLTLNCNAYYGCKTINYNINNNGWNTINNISSFSDLNSTEISTTSTSYVLGLTKTITKPFYSTDVNITTVKVNLRKYCSGPCGASTNNSTFIQFIYSDNTDLNTSEQNGNNTTYTLLTFTNPNQAKSVKEIKQYYRMASSGANASYTKDLNAIGFYQLINSSTNFLFSGAGSHSIQYFSTDNSDNNETIKTNNFTTYGKIRFNIYDENTGTTLTGVTINDGITDYNTGTNYYYDFNLQGITSTTKTFSISKTGYAERLYTVDLNQFSDLNISFLLLDNNRGQDLSFTVFSPSLMLLPNSYIEIIKPNKNNYTVSRVKTDADAKATVFISTSDVNYNYLVDGYSIYTPVLLTIKKPKKEIDGTDLNTITNPFDVTITGPSAQSYTNKSVDVNAYLLTNTTDSYNISINDSNGLYFKRTYQLTFPGNPGTYILQPYLLSYSDGISVKVTVWKQNQFTIFPYPDVAFDMYKETGYGKVLIENKVTDNKGEALVILYPGDSYLFRLFYLGSLIAFEGLTEIPIKATGSEVHFIVSDVNAIIIDNNRYGYNTLFKDTKVTRSIGNSWIDFNFLNYGNKYYSLTYYLDVNGTLVPGTSTTTGYAGTSDRNNYDYNILFTWANVPADTNEFRITVIATDFDTQKVWYWYRTYHIYQSGDFDSLALIRNGFRNQFFGCTAGSYCIGSAIAWLIFSLGLMLIIFVKFGVGQVMNPLSFAGFMALGAYLNWVPVEVAGIIALAAIGLYMIERR